METVFDIVMTTRFGGGEQKREKNSPRRGGDSGAVNKRGLIRGSAPPAPLPPLMFFPSSSLRRSLASRPPAAGPMGGAVTDVAFRATKGKQSSNYHLGAGGTTHRLAVMQSVSLRGIRETFSWCAHNTFYTSVLLFLELTIINSLFSKCKGV